MVTAVLDALKIKRDSGVSIGTFGDILQYVKRLLLASLDDKNIDRDILITLWPKTWNEVQSLLREEGFEDAKQYHICICHQVKQLTKTPEAQSIPTVGNTASWKIRKNFARTVVVNVI